MRRRGLWAACVVLLAGMGVLAAGGFAKDDNTVAKCSEATLHGTYLYADHGFDITGDDCPVIVRRPRALPIDILRHA